MNFAGSARYLLVVATIAIAISLGCAAPKFGLTLSSPCSTSDSAPTSLPSKLQLRLPKIACIFNTKKYQLPQTSPDDKQQDSQQPPKQQPQQIPPKPTVAKQPGGKHPYQSLANASVRPRPRPSPGPHPPPRPEMTTHDVHQLMDVPLKKCSEGQVLNRHLECVPKPETSTNPEDEEN